MKQRKSNSERGQALILIVFAIIGLVGLTALTVDGGLAYSDRRRAQNAADTAAFAAGRSFIKADIVDWKGSGLDIAALNGYTDTDATATSSSSRANVEIYQCTDADATCGEYADEAIENPDEYIQVLITSTINTYFGRVIGVNQLTNKVNSVVHARPGQPDPLSYGDALSSFMPGCTGWPKDPLKMNGGSEVHITGSGVFVNSNCTDPISDGVNYIFDSPGGICVVGALTNPNDYETTPNKPQGSCGTQKPLPPPIDPTCDFIDNDTQDPAEMGSINGSGLMWTATPGYFNGDFPPPSVAGRLFLDKGLYCIEGGDFKSNSGMVITSDWNDNGVFEYISEGVLIRVETRGISLNGGSTLDLHAISDPSVPLAWQNLLFYLPPGNTSTVKINGNSTSVLTGTILATSSHVELAGSAGMEVNSQVLGYSLEFVGGAAMDLNYDQSQNMIFMSPPAIELAQ